LVAADDHAGQPVGPAQCGRRGPHVPGVDTAADVRGREHHTIGGNQRSVLHGEAERAPESFEQGHVAGRAVPEPEVVADHDRRRVQRLDQHIVHERIGVEPGERRRERHHAERIHTELLDQLGLADRLGQHRRMRARADHLGRVRVERHHHRLQTEVAGAFHGVPDDRLVAAVHTVEDADRHHRPAPATGHRLVSPPTLHPPASPSMHPGPAYRSAGAPETLRLMTIWVPTTGLSSSC
jgi:hypothetical protein